MSEDECECSLEEDGRAGGRSYGTYSITTTENRIYESGESETEIVCECGKKHSVPSTTMVTVTRTVNGRLPPDDEENAEPEDICPNDQQQEEFNPECQQYPNPPDKISTKIVKRYMRGRQSESLPLNTCRCVRCTAMQTRKQNPRGRVRKYVNQTFGAVPTKEEEKYQEQLYGRLVEDEADIIGEIHKRMGREARMQEARRRLFTQADLGPDPNEESYCGPESTFYRMDIPYRARQQPTPDTPGAGYGYAEYRKAKAKRERQQKYQAQQPASCSCQEEEHEPRTRRVLSRSILTREQAGLEPRRPTQKQRRKCFPRQKTSKSKVNLKKWGEESTIIGLGGHLTGCRVDETQAELRRAIVGEPRPRTSTYFPIRTGPVAASTPRKKILKKSRSPKETTTPQAICTTPRPPVDKPFSSSTAYKPKKTTRWSPKFTSTKIYPQTDDLPSEDISFSPSRFAEAARPCPATAERYMTVCQPGPKATSTRIYPSVEPTFHEDMSFSPNDFDQTPIPCPAAAGRNRTVCRPGPKATSTRIYPSVEPTFHEDIPFSPNDFDETAIPCPAAAGRNRTVCRPGPKATSTRIYPSVEPTFYEDISFSPDDFDEFARSCPAPARRNRTVCRSGSKATSTRIYPSVEPTFPEDMSFSLNDFDEFARSCPAPARRNRTVCRPGPKATSTRIYPPVEPTFPEDMSFSPNDFDEVARSYPAPARSNRTVCRPGPKATSTRVYPSVEPTFREDRSFSPTRFVQPNEPFPSSGNRNEYCSGCCQTGRCGRRK
ncbi:hypothetical protein L9F63_011379 [Diploptera punctata]|uniref:Uncharacterized protein n=1 Tax=Diploptera punctata TaxID=6984 RepID=A0AAD8AEV4_DIPPU|nr:hypothetical protein L9F63_011379 [Diploptera punctata]